MYNYPLINIFYSNQYVKYLIDLFHHGTGNKCLRKFWFWDRYVDWLWERGRKYIVIITIRKFLTKQKLGRRRRRFDINSNMHLR
jgi:hypothetical protein